MGERIIILLKIIHIYIYKSNEKARKVRRKGVRLRAYLQSSLYRVGKDGRKRVGKSRKRGDS